MCLVIFGSSGSTYLNLSLPGSNPIYKIMTTQPTQGSVLRSGDTVKIIGLTAATHLNGSLGKLVGLCEESGRWVVELPCGKKQIKRANLEHYVGDSATMALQGCIRQALRIFLPLDEIEITGLLIAISQIL